MVMVKVKRKAVEASMTCPLCGEVLKEATAINRCLHTFCRKCIHERLSNEDASCPVCNIDLGCLPLDTLRPDHNIQDKRSKIFPPKWRKACNPMNFLVEAAKIITTSKSETHTQVLCQGESEMIRLFDAYETSQTEKSAQLEGLLRQVEELKAVASEQRDRIHDLECQVTELTTALAQRNKKLCELRAELSDWDAKLRASGERIAFQSERLSEARREISVLKNELVQAQSLVGPEENLKATSLSLLKHERETRHLFNIAYLPLARVVVCRIYLLVTMMTTMMTAMARIVMQHDLITVCQYLLVMIDGSNGEDSDTSRSAPGT